MLAQLDKVKARLGLADSSMDEMITRAIEAVSVRFDRECNRMLARTVGAAEEFDGDDTEIRVRSYPIETVTGFELKTSEAGGWVQQTVSSYLVRRSCVISLSQPLSAVAPTAFSSLGIGRVTYTGGYVLPGTTAGTGQTALPVDLESAAIEQVSAWFQQRDKLGLIRYWPSGGTYLVFIQLPLLPQVSATLRTYQRWCV
jgi:hypothetical protein